MPTQCHVSLLSAVAIMLVLATPAADAVALRTGADKKSAVGTATAGSMALKALLSKSTAEVIEAALSKDKSKVAVFKKLTSKYNCAEDAKSLVSKLNTITDESQATSDALNVSCSRAQSSLKHELAVKLAKANNLTASAASRGKAVYAAGFVAANKTFFEVKAFHELAVKAASKHLLDAGTKTAEAEAFHSEKAELHRTAQALFDQKTKLLDEAVFAQIAVLRGNRDAIVISANTSNDEQMASARRDMNGSNARCNHAYTIRSALVDQDESVMNDKIKPLLLKLDECDADSGSGIDVSANSDRSHSDSGSVSSGATNDIGASSLVEIRETVSASAQCKQDVQSGLQHLRTSFLQISMGSPARDAGGNIDDWKARLDAERVNAENVRDACLAEVQSAYNKTKRDLNKVLSETVRHANTFFDGEVAKLKERTATSKAKQKVALDATAVPAFEAEAVLNVAKAAMDEAKAAAKAASDMKAFTITEAQSSMDEAVRSSRQAEAETVKSIKAAAEVLRQSARKDSRLRSHAKRLECDQEQQSLLEERILVDEIRVHISTLTATKDDTVEKRAVDKAAKR